MIPPQSGRSWSSTRAKIKCIEIRQIYPIEWISMQFDFAFNVGKLRNAISAMIPFSHEWFDQFRSISIWVGQFSCIFMLINWFKHFHLVVSLTLRTLCQPAIKHLCNENQQVVYFKKITEQTHWMLCCALYLKHEMYALLQPPQTAPEMCDDCALLTIKMKPAHAGCCC